MQRRTTLLLLLAATLLGQPQPAKSTFLVIYKPGPSFIQGKPLKEQPLQEHGRYILSLYGKGVLKFAGPFGDDTGGAAVLETASEAEAKTIVANDPAVVSHIFVTEMHPWELVQWERLSKK